ncbi:hypothetical protein [Streptomonospora wellingtoniae]|uniref:ATP synthase protein I n=1 Tax=Streptomonospora wellingtoniae TaxID=3075544 RepID=A0ABU2KR80_9ACTN|nr:hypothetical protein [Streptomonospora sp. DSM 45055]MDT0301721.1 hypothetical protein [Streptomonospora sp. DSM 45055]
MKGHDARILRGAAIPTAAAGALAMAVAGFAAGTQAFLGAATGAVLALVFFGLSFLIVTWAGDKNPKYLYPAAMGTYLAKIVLLGVLLVAFGDAAVFNHLSFAITASACTVVWMGAHMWALNTAKILYVEPAEEGT